MVRHRQLELFAVAGRRLRQQPCRRLNLLQLLHPLFLLPQDGDLARRAEDEHRRRLVYNPEGGDGHRAARRYVNTAASHDEAGQMRRVQLGRRRLAQARYKLDEGCVRANRHASFPALEELDRNLGHAGWTVAASFLDDMIWPGSVLLIVP